MNNARNVSTGKPQIQGAIFSAPIGTELPKDAKTKLNETFKCLGYVSDDGIKNDNSPSTDDIKAWGGNTVLTLQKEKPDKFKYTLIEALNIDVLKAVYGADNVSGDLDTGITVKANNSERDYNSWVIEMIMSEGILKRIVIPNAKVSDVGGITYKDDDAIGYEITLNASPDEAGNTHYEYIVKSEA